jgi:hypothetical protein
MSNVLICV